MLADLEHIRVSNPPLDKQRKADADSNKPAAMIIDDEEVQMAVRRSFDERLITIWWGPKGPVVTDFFSEIDRAKSAEGDD